MKKEGIIIDKIKWIIGEHPPKAIPICPKDHVKLSTLSDDTWDKNPCDLVCEECSTLYKLPRRLKREQQYVLDKIDSKTFKSMRFINLDDEAIPIAEDKTYTEDNKYFVKALLTKSKTGIRLVVYAGKKGCEKKVQIFIEPEIKRLSFDQNDMHPTDIFSILEATFADGVKSKLIKGNGLKKTE